MPQNAENESSDAIDINDNGVSRKYTLFGEHYELLSQLLRTVLVPVPKWLRQKKKKTKKKKQKKNQQLYLRHTLWCLYYRWCH